MSGSVNFALRLLAIAALMFYAATQLFAYPAEWQIAEANARLERVLRRLDEPNQGAVSVARALELSSNAMRSLPGDPRPVLLASGALTMLGKSADAIALLDHFVALAERPELVVALGRARAAEGNEPAARAAFLRAAWASPPAIATLPKAVRQALLDDVAVLAKQLAAGKLTAPPPVTVP